MPKRGNKRNGSLYSFNDAALDKIPPSKRERAIQRNVAHADDWMMKIAVALRLQEYAEQRMLIQMIDGHPRQKWLEKVRKDFTHMPIEMSPKWYEQQQQMLIDMALPPLPKT